MQSARSARRHTRRLTRYRSGQGGKVGDIEARGDDAAQQGLLGGGGPGGLPAAAAYHVLGLLAGRHVRPQGDRQRLGRGARAGPAQQQGQRAAGVS